MTQYITEHFYNLFRYTWPFIKANEKSFSLVLEFPCKAKKTCCTYELARLNKNCYHNICRKELEQRLNCTTFMLNLN